MTDWIPTEPPPSVEFRDFSEEELSSLALLEGEPCVTIFLKTWRQGPEAPQAKKVLSDLLDEAHQKLQEEGVSQKRANYLVQAGRELLEDYDAWRHMKEGLALYLSGHEAVAYRVAHDLPNRVTVGRPVVYPLLPALDAARRYYILSVTQDQVRLLEATSESVERVETPFLPEGLEDALPENAGREPELQGRPTGGTAGYHGHGGADVFEVQVERYLQLVGKGLKSYFHRKAGSVVILATVPHYVSTLKEASGYQHFSDEIINGAHSHLTDRELHELSRPIFTQVLNRYKERYERLVEDAASAKKLETSLEAIAEVAAGHRVERLILPKPTLTEEGESSSLVEGIIRSVLEGGGRVSYDEYLLPEAVALLRY